MQKKNQNPDSFERRSHFNDARDSYIDKDGNYVYTQWVKVGKNYERRVVDIIPLTAENRDIIILLDGSDHDMDLGDEYEERHRDYGTGNRRQAQADPDSDSDFHDDPIDQVADPNADVFGTLYPEEEQQDPLVGKAEQFIHEKLQPQQVDMVYGHLGEGKFLEEMRREEESRSGKEIRKQSYHGRWDKIITKGCKYFGVEKPKKQVHRKPPKQGD